jgi:thiosulfate/3-mercaptopyruvate sulfurtransferase
MAEPDPELLVDPEWLAARLGDPQVRVFDCRITRVPQPSGASSWASGRADYEAGHIPGALYLHMVDDLCDRDGDVPLTLADIDTVSALLSRLGVEAGTTMVLYGSGGESAVHRVWWALSASGARDVRILDGGLARWCAERRALQTAVPGFPPARFAGKARARMVVGADEVAAILGDAAHCLVHSLTEEQFFGLGGQVYGRPGRIPGSINVPAGTLIDPETGRFRPIEDLATIFALAGLEEPDAIIPYCGGGIAASTVFFALKLLGHDNVRLYDGSLLEWSRDPARPMVTGPQE